MRKIKVEYWKGKNSDGSEEEENTIIALGLLINSQRPENLPRGIDKFRLFNRLSVVFDKAKKTKELIFEEGDYEFLKNIIDNDIPAIWGINTNISIAIENFLNAKKEE